MNATKPFPTTYLNHPPKLRVTVLTTAQEDTGLYNFSNIRYAQPPVGSLRFRAPQPPAGRNEEVQVGSEGRICPQAAPEWTLVASQFVEAFVQGEASDFDTAAAVETAKQESADSGQPAPLADGNPYITEDCLFLDVIVPSAVFDAKKSPGPWYKSNGAPVLVWYVTASPCHCNSGADGECPKDLRRSL